VPQRWPLVTAHTGLFGYVRGHRVDKDATEWLSMQDEDGSFIHYKG
jgi:hypothetical protein